MRLILTLICIYTTVALHAQQWYFWIDEWQPAERVVLKDAQDVLLVNNTIVQPADFGHSIKVDGQDMANEYVLLDNAALHCLFAATQQMDERMLFERVEMQEKTQNTSTNYYARQPLSKERMQCLCREYQVEALLILNQLVLYNVLESFPSEDERSYYAYLQAYAQSHWTVYRATTNRAISFSSADTLLWESDWQYTRTAAVGQLPSRNEALLYLAREVGINAANSLMPQWVPAQRYLYEHDNAQLQAGLEAFRYQRWQEAIHHWLLILDDKAISRDNKKATACAAANIAIAYEMLGDYDSACDYAQRAISLFGAWKTAYGRQQQVNIRYYLEQLRVRKVKERDR